MAKRAQTQVLRLFQRAERLALQEVERRARKILAEHPVLDEFVMAMGTAFFNTKDGRIVTNDDLKYLAPVFDWIDEWDSELHLTGTPMRFTAKGKMVTDW